ncbi:MULTISPECIES: ATP-binding protein [Flavobacteriaceae]|uniref:Uncharacterized protein n=2 Tax=Flavobacteriaceae TaxID=49546 RepID=A0A4Y8ATC7_9FLAO|nr:MULTISPECIES: ATP-binding protein [Flavobacteriaceae]TEW75127.1 hypothetical protein E2488_06285 [Gramella jeungdoensis]GGK41362.1 hypothetical protein GCM10007963_06730 [Lutibacter litoralis]
MLEEEMTLEKEVTDLINKNIETYKINPSRIISDFRGEKQTTDDYRGRQLLELLQNADDAKTSEIGIFLDTENNKLSVANNGEPFDLKGIESLLLANFSPKNKKEFIGNKGLGFRSILNWTTEINVKTKEFVLTFSPDLAKENFEKFIPNYLERTNLIQENKKYLNKGEVPMAILALPKYRNGNLNQEWDTIIELTYDKEIEGEIIEQLKTISPRILLFLNHTNQIEISGAGDLDTLITRSFIKEDKTEIEINEKQWHIEDSGEIAYPDDDEKFYQYKIAWQDDLSDEDSKFFTYFPTEVNTQLPYLIHATFELNQSRNDLLKGDENQFLLLEIAETIGNIALTKIRNEEKSDWQAFQFLEPLYSNSNPKLNTFFEKLLALQNEMEIFPCVDGSYCILENAVFYGDEFSNWVIRNNVGMFFPNLMKPLESNEISGHYYKVYTAKYWLEIIKALDANININERALLIKHLTDSKFNEIHKSDVKLPLLIDNFDKVIPENEQAFMLSKEDIEQYNIPKYVDISFMSGELYEELTAVLENEIQLKRIEKEHQSRPLKRIISQIVNIGSNDITDVIRNIITTSEKQIKEVKGNEQTNIIEGLVNSLFSIYKVNPDRRNSINLNIPLLSKDLEICNAKDLYLGEDFEFGKSTSIIFEGIFSNNDYIIGNDFWGLEEDGIGYLENFFIWLGVNRITRKNQVRNYLDRYEENQFTKFVFNNTHWPENKSHKEYQVTEILNFNSLVENTQFSIEILIAWILKDPDLLRQLNFENDDNFSYKYNTKTTPINYKPSYIYYQIKELYLNKINKQFIVDSEFPKELGYDAIDFEHRVFKKLGILESDIITILNQLQISLTFNDLGVEDVFQIIKDLPETDLEGKYARKVYNLAFKYFKTKEDVDFSMIDKEYKLLAKNKNIKEYKNINKVYYSDNSTLPSKISEEFWMFDFPKRAGESQISKYFGVKTFKDVQLKIKEETIVQSNVFSEFEAWFNKTKPFILAYRLSSIKNSIEKSQAHDLKYNKINIVSSLMYEIENGEEKQLLPGEFLPQPNDKGYYLCVEQNSTLENLKDTPSVCEAFAEILCMIFKVNDHKDDYRAIFKDRKSLRDSKYLIDVKSLIESFSLAQELLGISSSEIDFWRKIYQFWDVDFPENLSDSTELSNKIATDLGFEVSKKYLNIDFENLDSIEGVDFLKDITEHFKIPLTEVFAPLSNGAINYHKSNFETTIRDNKKYFDSCLWEELNANPKKQKNLINFQEKYEDIINSKEIENLLFEHRFELEVNYLQFLKAEVKRIFDIELLEEQTTIILLQPENQEILNENKIEEAEIEDPQIRSLLYFKGNVAKLKLALEVENQESTDIELDDNPTEKITGEIIYSSSSKIVPKAPTNKGVKRGGWNHSDKDTKRNKKAGKKAEERVYNSLMDSEDVVEVEWVSSFSNTSDKSDNKHYDIRYKPVNSASWKYLEVKSFNGSYFHLSQSEKEEGIKRGKDFEIALVLDDKIHILEDYFKEDIDFENNKFFYATPADYIITLKLKKENE